MKRINIEDFKSAQLVVFLLFFVIGCSPKNEKLKIGFGKSNLTYAGIFEDPVVENNSSDVGKKYRREEKFAISDRVEGRWRPGSGGIRELADSIYVSAMYGEDANGPWAIITLDKTTIEYEELDLIESPLIKDLGISKERLVFLPSHGHATPPLDPVKYQQAVFNAVSEAKQNRLEVEVASLNLKLDGKKYSINRRVNVKGIGSRTVMFNDGCIVHDNYVDATQHVYDWMQNLGVDPEKYLEQGKEYNTNGDVDNKLQALFIRDKKSGNLKGSFLRFASHAVIVSSKVVNGDVSADYPGYLKQKIENSLGGIALFGQGPCGDLRPLNKEYSHAFAKVYGEKLADKLIDGYNNLEWESLSKMAFYSEPVSLPLLDNIFYSDKELKEEMDKIEVQYDKETNPMRRRELQNKFWGLYRTPWVHRMVRPEWKEKKQLDIKLYGIQFNDKVLVAMQGEIFNQIGKEMMQPFADKNPILVSIANEYVSYIPTDEERQKGGYEPSVSIVEPGSPDLLVDGAHKLLGRIYGN